MLNAVRPCMGKLFLAALLTALLLAGCVQPGAGGQPLQGQEPKPVAAPQILENGQPKAIMPESFGGVNYTWYSSPMFFLYYPRGWTAEEPGNGQFTFTAPVEGDPERNVADQLIVEIWAGEEATAEEFTAYEASLMLPGDTVTKKEATRFKDREAFVIEMEGTDGRTQRPMFYKTIFFRNGKWVYRLQYSMESGRRETIEPLFEDMLSRFVVGDYPG